MSGGKDIAQVIADIAAAGKPYLGDPEVAGGLVQQYVTGILLRQDENEKGLLSDAALSKANDVAKDILGRIMCGRDPDYTPIEGWTGVDEMQGKFLRRAMTGRDEPLGLFADEPCRAVAFALLLEVMRAMMNFDMGGDPTVYKDSLVAIVTKGTRLFMGLPTEAELAGA